MALDKIRFEWQNEYQGKMITPTTSLNMGAHELEFRPYQLLFGALGGCFYSTLIGIVKKNKLEFSSARMEITGTKVEEVPTVLKDVLIKLVIINPSSEKGFLKTAELSAKYCSIHETISKVAEIKLEVEFEYI